LVGGYIARGNFLGTETGTQGAEPMRHLPDAVLIGDQYEAVTPSKPVRTIEALGMPLNPIGLAVAVVVAQQREVTFALLGEDHVTVRQYQQAARMLQPGREGCHGETVRHLWFLILVRDNERATRHDWSRLWRRQVFRLHREFFTNLLLRQRSRVERRARRGSGRCCVELRAR